MLAEVVSCLGSLVQSCCREGGALQTNVTGVCGEHSQCSGHTGFAPAHGCVLSPSTPFRLLAALQGVGPELLALPRPKPLRFRFSGPPQRRRLGWGADWVGPAFCAFPTRAAQAARRLTSALSPGAVRLLPSTVPASVSARASPVCLVSVLGSWPLASTLPADVDHPESQEAFG